MKTQIRVASYGRDGMIDKNQTFLHYIYKGRGLAIAFRQHMLRELMRLDAGEIGHIRITSKRGD